MIIGKVTNRMSWRNEGEQAEKLADKAPKWTGEEDLGKHLWKAVDFMWVLPLGACNHCLIMVKDDHWSAELASGRRSGCRADKYKDQLGHQARVRLIFIKSLPPRLYFRHSVSAFFSFAEDTVFPTAHRGRLCLPS